MNKQPITGSRRLDNGPSCPTKKKTRVKVKEKHRLNGTFGPVFPYGAKGSDYWAALEAFNEKRDEERRHDTT